MNRAAAVILALALAGCQAAGLVGPIVTGVVTWVNGEAHCYYDHTPAVVTPAVTRACRQLALPVGKTERDGTTTIVRAGGADRFVIKVIPETAAVTRVSVRVNFMGDKDYAELLYKQIADQMDVVVLPR